MIFVFFQIFISHEYRPLLDFLKSKKIIPRKIVDAGANVGYFSKLVAHEFPDSTLVSIEPESGNVAQLRRNLDDKIQSNQLFIVPAALWTRKSRLTIKKEEVREWAFSVSETTGGQLGDCDSLSLQDIMTLASFDHIDLLKLDIEGTEGLLFADVDFQNLLSKVTVIAMEIHDHLANRKKIHDTLVLHSFEFFEKGELTVAWNKKIQS
jgi:FkbM family methyltransferase